tara:strand:+ start:503 stop:679 length:177 start_codon:yes stop_codon:yes gene_type:complete
MLKTNFELVKDLEKRIKKLEKDSHTPQDYNVKIYVLEDKVNKLEKIINKCLNTKVGGK